MKRIYCIGISVMSVSLCVLLQVCTTQCNYFTGTHNKYTHNSISITNFNL